MLYSKWDLIQEALGHITKRIEREKSSALIRNWTTDLLAILLYRYPATTGPLRFHNLNIKRSTQLIILGSDKQQLEVISSWAHLAA